MSSFESSSPVSASTLAYLMRWPVFRLIWLKLTFSESEVAGYSATGQVTRERRKNPFQLARGAMANSNTTRRITIPLRNPDSSAGWAIRSAPLLFRAGWLMQWTEPNGARPRRRPEQTGREGLVGQPCRQPGGFLFAAPGARSRVPGGMNAK